MEATCGLAVFALREITSLEGHRALLRVQPMVQQAQFVKAQSYDEFNPRGFLIYCDPPYQGNRLSNKLFRNFDWDKFWDTMRRWSRNNLVVISERTAPADFVPICTLQSHLTTGGRHKTDEEYLFVSKNQETRKEKKIKTRA